MKFLNSSVLMGAIFTATLSTSAFAADKAPAKDAASGMKTRSIKLMTIDSGKVTFLAVGKPSFLKINGTGGKPEGSLTVADEKASGTFTFNLASLDAANETRTEHMKNKYLEVEKFPTATITFKDVEAKGDTVKTDIPAMLTLHGQTKPVTLKAELDQKVAKATFKLNVTEFGMEKPRYGGIGVEDDIVVNIDTVLK